jgi:hypothetical protein
LASVSHRTWSFDPTTFDAGERLTCNTHNVASCSVAASGGNSSICMHVSSGPAQAVSMCAGELLNCNTYDVAIHASVACGVDKIICMHVESLDLPEWLSLRAAADVIFGRGNGEGGSDGEGASGGDGGDGGAAESEAHLRPGARCHVPIVRKLPEYHKCTAGLFPTAEWFMTLVLEQKKQIHDTDDTN